MNIDLKVLLRSESDKQKMRLKQYKKYTILKIEQSISYVGFQTKLKDLRT